ncbi:hypothetical protein [Staphylococcus warneri]|uniref:hypothetical protein n=1 Tax=Staphylococcus warneri TaxID=1292 RepID=UPI000F6E8114|nr:hypothetical protein [Staphylococcus warneri]VED30029.1 Uncharacterised protein [Staphylococcus warneri]
MLATIICWIIVIIMFYIFYRMLKSKIKKMFGFEYTNTHSYQDYQSYQEETSIDSTEAVDKMIIHALKYHETLTFEEERLKTSTGYEAIDIYDRINSLIQNSSRIADELQRNESELVPGNSSSSIEGFKVTMSNYDVKINLIGWTVGMSLSHLQSLSSVNDLKDEIDNGLILSHDAFRTY